MLGIPAILFNQLSAIITGGGGASNANLTLEGEPMIGNPDANVTVVEFGDFQCPACSQFEQGPYQQLKEEYIDTGQVKFYWKDYPLNRIHPWAQNGAETMECVYRQNQTAFWNVKNTLFENQQSIEEGSAQDTIIGWAEEEGVSGEAVRSCVSGAESEVRDDKREGRANNVQGTPTIFVNGEQLDSFQYSTIQAAIDQELEN
jgi:protein-disulfide isomerase